MVSVTIELTNDILECEVYSEDITKKGYLIEWKRGYERQMLCSKCYESLKEDGHGEEFRILGTWG